MSFFKSIKDTIQANTNKISASINTTINNNNTSNSANSNPTSPTHSRNNSINTSSGGSSIYDYSLYNTPSSSSSSSNYYQSLKSSNTAVKDSSVIPTPSSSSSSSSPQQKREITDSSSPTSSNDNKLVIKTNSNNDQDYIIEIWGNNNNNNQQQQRDKYEIIEFSNLYSKQSIVSLSAGAIHSAVITDTGLIYTWGEGALGRLGHGDQESQMLPKLVEQMTMYRAIGVSAGGKHTLVLTDQGLVYSFGSNDSYQLGLGSNINQSFIASPTRISSIGDRIVSIATGGNRSAAIGMKGGLYTWGRGEHGRNGHGDTYMVNTPKLIQVLQGHIIIDVSCGGGHSMALTDKGQVFSWGRGESGQLGHGSYQHQQLTPKMVYALQDKPPITKISCGGYHSLAIDQKGITYAWGRSDYGVLGGFDDGNHNLPRQVMTPVAFSEISAGFQHNIAITTNNEIYSWGCGIGKRLGNQSEKHIYTPTKVNTSYQPLLISSGEIVSIVIGTTKKHEQVENQHSLQVQPQQPSPLEPSEDKKEIQESNILKPSSNIIDNDIKRTSSPTPSFESLASEKNLVGKDLLISTQINLIGWLEKINQSNHILQCIVESKIRQRSPPTEDLIKELKDTTQIIKSLVQEILNNNNNQSPFNSSNSLTTTTTTTTTSNDNNNNGIQEKQEQLESLVGKRNLLLNQLKQQLEMSINYWDEIIKQKSLLQLNLKKYLQSYNPNHQNQTKISTSELQKQCNLLKERLDHSIGLFCSNITQSIQQDFQVVERVRLSMEEIQLIVVESIKYGEMYLDKLETSLTQIQELKNSDSSQLSDVNIQMEKISKAMELFEEREKIKSEYRSCKRTSIETSKKLEVLELEEDMTTEENSIQSLKEKMNTLKKEEQRLLSRQKELNDTLSSLIEKYSPELKFKLNQQDKISNKIKDTGLLTERKFNHYDIIKTLSSHPHNVYLASFDDQLVVLKEFGIGDQFGKQMFERQVSLMKLMSHKCIMPIQAVFYDRNAYIQMEYIKGGTLVDWLKKSSPSSSSSNNSSSIRTSSSPTDQQQIIVHRNPWEIQKVFQQIIQAISYMHSNGIVHRDLKLENVLMNENDTPVISDFDLSKDISIINSNATMFSGGTEMYRAPEMREKGSTGSYSTDIWAFGVMLYKSFFPKAKDPYLMPGELTVTIPAHSDQNLINLLSIILQKNYNARPTADQIAVHPYFITSQVENLIQSKSLIDSREKIAAFRAHVSSLTTMLEENNDAILVSIRREYLIQDVFSFFSKLNPSKLFSKFEIEFVGEKGIDHGGLQSEMYSIFFNDSIILNQIKTLENQHPAEAQSSSSSSLKSIFSSKYQLFERNSDESPFYLITNQDIDMDESTFFKVSNIKTEKEVFKTLGKIFLKAVIDGKPIPDVFPPTFFKYLLGVEKNTIHDLEAFDPQMAQSFKKVLLLDDIDQYLSTTFEGLIEGGEEIPVTDANKEEFIQRNIDRLLVESRKYRLDSFKSGFCSVDSLNAHFKLFSPSELQLLMCGSVLLDANLLKQHIRFIGFPPTSQTPTYLLETLSMMSQHELQLFLRFVTGMVSISLEGIEKPLLIVHIPNIDKLPSAHTCTHQLNLPDYNSQPLLHSKIIQMLEWLDSGFAFV